MKNILTPTKEKRFLFFLVSDILIFAISLNIALLIRFDLKVPLRYENVIIYWVPLFIFFKILTFSFFKIYTFSWRFISLNEFFKILESLFISTSLLFFLDVFFQRNLNSFSLPLSVIIIDFFISSFLILSFRISKRVYMEILARSKKGKRTLIIGAGDTGERLVRDILKNKNSNLNPVCFVDDDPMKEGIRIHGIPVCGTLKDIFCLAKKNRIEVAIIAIPTLNHKKTKEIFETLKGVGVEDIKVVPSMFEEIKEEVTVKVLKNISIEDILYREPIKIEKEKIKDCFKNKNILVSGAGGSIGSEIVRQLIDFSPKSIIALEIDETELHNLVLELNKKTIERNINFYPIVGDIRDGNKLNKIFSEYEPELVFHAAAYKHVPLMECFPEEAVKTNIFGTYNMAISSIENGVEKFINISTDKAVNPISVMGATKKVAEMICDSLNEMGKTKFVSVRFGNVLGSRGSVIHIFLEQIKKGGPLTVTHPDVKRYFMTIREAVLLVFQSAYMGKGGEIFVLDMGEPIKIINLAEDLIKLHGLEPYKDINVVFTGLRPGEKMFEELFTSEENIEKTYHPKIFVIKNSNNIVKKDIEMILEEISKIVEKENSSGKIKKILKKIVPSYKEEI